jgi:hypothetical protein
MAKATGGVLFFKFLNFRKTNGREVPLELLNLALSLQAQVRGQKSEVEGRIEGKVAGLSRHPKKGNYVWFSPLGAEQPWQGDSFSGCGFSVDTLCKCGKPRLGRWLY